MNRTITSEETEKLFAFCRRHYIAQYDLQVELVDHLATAIEEQWQENPEISFDTALSGTFKKFGISGFSKIKAQKQKELAHKYNLLIWKYLLEFFSWPKIILTGALTLVLVTIFRLAEKDNWVLATIFMSISIIVLIHYLFIFPKNYKKVQINGKKFLLLEQLGRGQILSFALVQFMVQSPTLLRIFKINALQNTLGIFAISLFIVVLCIILYGEMFFVPSKIKEHFKEQFPEFAL
jgi:hypothetical protein